jgi:hypothetical protein
MQRLQPYPLLACHTRHATKLDTSAQGAQHQVVDAEKYSDIKQSQGK